MSRAELEGLCEALIRDRISILSNNILSDERKYLKLDRSIDLVVDLDYSIKQLMLDGYTEGVVKMNTLSVKGVYKIEVYLDIKSGNLMVLGLRDGLQDIVKKLNT